MGILRAAPLLALLFSCAGAPPPAPAAPPAGAPAGAPWTRSPDGAPTRWAPDQLPLLIYLHASAAAWEPEVREAAAAWNDAAGCGLFVVVGPDPAFPPLEALEGGVVPVVLLGNRPHTKYMAHVETGAMFRVVIILPGGTFSRAHAPAIAAHELGHALGLAHAPEPSALMHARIDTSRPPPTFMPETVRRLRRRYCPAAAPPRSRRPLTTAPGSAPNTP